MLLPADTAKLPYFLEAIPDLKKVCVLGAGGIKLEEDVHADRVR